MRRDTCCIVALSLNLLQKVHPIIWSLSNLPYDCCKVVAVPKPIGGFILLSRSFSHRHRRERFQRHFAGRLDIFHVNLITILAFVTISAEHLQCMMKMCCDKMNRCCCVVQVVCWYLRSTHYFILIKVNHHVACLSTASPMAALISYSVCSL
jgi:hypothetical protein